MKIYLKIILIIIVFIIINTKSNAQINFTRNDSIIVLNTSGDTLKNPWAGGFNSVQFSEIDLNIDGKKDLLVFDRTGNRLSTFINLGIPNQVSYKHAPEYIKIFPAIHDWILLRDYNCDGKMDIFTYGNGGMAAYTNTSTTQLSFVLDTSLIYSDYNPNGPAQYINLYISSSDIPAIDDIDGDGDLDVLTFSILGSHVEYHKNLSIEKYGDCSHLDFQLKNKCWGFFRENMSNNSVTLDDTCSFNINNPERNSGGNKHAGSTLLTMDVDANNSKDLILGDVSFNNLTLLINGDASPNLTQSYILSQDSAFPKNNISTIAADIEIFPAGFYLDVNNDNIKDLIAAPNCYNGCKNINNVWFYENNNANNNPNFNFIQNSFLQDGMIEIGEGAHPVFFDYNADGLMDIVVGSYGEYNSTISPLFYQSALHLYENIGTLSNPVFRLVDADYANISTINLDISNNRPTLGLAPTFGDIDGDGDMDMIIGDYNGFIHYFTNTAGVGNTANFVLTTPEYLNVDFGNDAVPLLYDLNKDTLLDLIVGKRNGLFSYYKNKGNVTTPNFNYTTDSLGYVKTRRFYDYNGNSNPVFIQDSGVTRFFSGCFNGYIYEFGNIDGNLTGNFSIVDSAYLNIWEGINSYISMADITNDGHLDMLVGNYSGGVAFFKGDTNKVMIGIKENSPITDFLIYPNPTNNLINIDLGNNELQNASIQLIDLLGKTLISNKVTHQKITLNISDYAQGVYLIKFNNSYGSKVYKIIKE